MNNSPDIRFFVDKKQVKALDLGIVPAGRTKQFIVKVVNKGVKLGAVKFDIDNKDVKIIKYPRELGEGDLILEYSPPIDVKQGARAVINIKGQYVV